MIKNIFNNTYNDFIKSFEIDSLYDVPSMLIDEEKSAYANLISKNNPSRSICPAFIEDDLICETTYFQGWDVNTSCVDAVNDIVNMILSRYSETYDIEDLSMKVKVRDLLTKIDYSSLSNYKNFHKFLDLMKANATGSITISVGQSDSSGCNDSYYEPPMKFGYPPKNGMIVDSYYQYIVDITKDFQTWHEKIHKIMNELFSLQDFGTINISSLAVNRSSENLKAVISHELSHFIKFLIRINSLNYKYGLYVSRSDLNYNVGQNYESKPDEWKELAATYIEELAIVFNEMSVEHTFNLSLKFIDLVLVWCGVNTHSIGKEDIQFYNTVTDLLSRHFHSNEIRRFIKTTYENSKNENTVRNNWKVFMKWLKNEFKKRFKEE